MLPFVRQEIRRFEPDTIFLQVRTPWFHTSLVAHCATSRALAPAFVSRHCTPQSVASLSPNSRSAWVFPGRSAGIFSFGNLIAWHPFCDPVPKDLTPPLTSWALDTSIDMQHTAVCLSPLLKSFSFYIKYTGRRAAQNAYYLICLLHNHRFEGWTYV